jgi:hypothetical protein
MSRTRPKAYEISSVYIALAIKRAIERATGAGDGRLRSRVGPTELVPLREPRWRHDEDQSG